MLIYKKHLSILSLVLCGLFLIPACGNLEESKARHIQQGKEYLNAENYDKARVELKNVLQIDPKSAETYNLLGQIEEHSQNWRKAIGYYNKAIELDPGLLEPHIRLGRFYIRQAASANARNNTNIETEYIQKAKGQIDTAFQIDPQYIDTIVLKASLLAYQGKDDEAIEVLRKALNINPTNSDAILLLSRLYTQKNLVQEAEKLLKDGIIASPNHMAIRIELAKFYAIRKQLDDATEVMKKIIMLEPEPLGHRLSLVSYYLQQENREKAEATYHEAIEAKPDDAIRYLAYADFIKKQEGLNAAIDYLKKNLGNSSNINKEISFRLASLYQENGDVDHAITVLNDISNDSKFKLTAIRARKQLISIFLTSNNPTKARSLIEEILVENPKDHDAILLKGKIAIQEKNYKSAIELLRTALNNQPDSIEIMHLLAESHLFNGEMHLAADLLKRATKINPGDINSRLKLARFMLASNENTQALDQVNHALQMQPKNINAIMLKSDILMSENKTQEVILLLNALKELAPDSAEAWFRMGRVHKITGKNNLARQEFISAHNKDPDSIDLLAELTDIEIKLGEINSTKTRLQNIIKTRPVHPAAHKFLGMAYLAEKEFDSAEKEFILNLKQSPNDVATYMQLAKMHYSRKNINQAAEYYSKGRALVPNNTIILSNLARIRSIQKKYDEAISLYENMLNIQPNNAVATNNLAMILTYNKSDPDSLLRAKQLIQNSSKKNHPALQDTLGWTYYLLGEYDNALSSLEKAITQAPNISTFHYHMGMAYIKKANTDFAKKHLQTALNLGDFPERIDAARTLDALNAQDP